MVGLEWHERERRPLPEPRRLQMESLWGLLLLVQGLKLRRLKRFQLPP